MLKKKSKTVVKKAVGQKTVVDIDSIRRSFEEDAAKEYAIQWPSPLDLTKVNRQISDAIRVGKYMESRGHRVDAGNLAYKVNEVIQAARDLATATNHTQASREVDGSVAQR